MHHPGPMRAVEYAAPGRVSLPAAVADPASQPDGPRPLGSLRPHPCCQHRNLTGLPALNKPTTGDPHSRRKPRHPNTQRRHSTSRPLDMPRHCRTPHHGAPAEHLLPCTTKSVRPYVAGHTSNSLLTCIAEATRRVYDRAVTLAATTQMRTATLVPPKRCGSPHSMPAPDYPGAEHCWP